MALNMVGRKRRKYVIFWYFPNPPTSSKMSSKETLAPAPTKPSLASSPVILSSVYHLWKEVIARLPMDDL